MDQGTIPRTEKGSASGGIAGRLRLVPWFCGAGALLLYLVTLNGWLSPLGLTTFARTSGWIWRAESAKPLSFIILMPLRLLPQAMLPVAMNLVSALGGALVLVLLARSVMLLRYDLPLSKPTHKGANPNLLAIPTAWIPPLFAVLLCGLELTFWERATSLTVENFDLLAFACALWCLLEFRVARKDTWLFRAVFAFGVGMADDWLFLLYFPAFFLAVLLLKSLGEFLRSLFLLRMTLWLLAGASLFLLLPVINAAFSHGEANFWKTLSSQFQAERAGLAILRSPAPRAMALVSFAPLLLLGIPWRSHTIQSSDDSRMGVWLTRATGHFVHALFFCACVWWALDPAFSPRHIISGGSILPMYFVSALTGGYCAGYFLLFGWPRSKMCLLLPKLVTGLVWALLFAVPVFLAAKNFPQIHTSNGPLLRNFARMLYDDLPLGKSVVLSDEWNLLTLVRAELASHHEQAKTPLLLEARSLASTTYQGLMAKEYPNRWPALAHVNSNGPVTVSQMQDLISAFGAREPVVYLHPSSGVFFERCYPQPFGSVEFLVSRVAGLTNDSRLAETLLAKNEKLWEERWSPQLQRLALRTTTESSRGPLARLLRLPPEPCPAVLLVAANCSKSLNTWGVELQRNEHWPQAGAWFQRAIQLNPNNLSARINSDFNERFLGGEKHRLELPSLQSLFPELATRQSDLAQVLNDGGPLDEPTMLFQVGRLFERSANPRQAFSAISRCGALAPEWPAPKLWLAQNFIAAEDFNQALLITDNIQSGPQPRAAAGLAELLQCRVTALRGLRRTNEASAFLESFVAEHREQIPVLSTAASLCATTRQVERELFFLETLAQLAPKNVLFLVRKGFAELQLSRFEPAAVSLTRALALDPDNAQARLHRAAAYLGAGELDAARADYEKLLTVGGERQNALFGLAGVAWRNHDTNSAVQCYERYLSNAVPSSAQYSLATKRLKLLKAGP